MKTSVLLKLLADFPGRRVLIVGDVMLDEYIWGEVRRISPEAPVPVVDCMGRSYVPGGAGNTAANVASLGGEALLAGVVGDDHSATVLADILRQRDVDLGGLIVDPERPTTTKTRIVAHHQQMVRVDSERRAALPAALQEKLLGWVEKQIGRADACILSDYAKGVISDRVAEGIIAVARRAGKPVVVDPKGADGSKYRGATLVKPNLHETERLLNREIHGEKALLAAGRELADVLDGAALLITRGPEGMSLFRKGHEPVHIASVAQDVFDVTGAGDTVVSALAMALAAGLAAEQAAHLANRAAGIVVGKVGTTALTLAELQTRLRAERRRPTTSGSKDLTNGKGERRATRK